MHTTHLILIISLVFVSCGAKKERITPLNAALELAGKNSNELKKVLSRYAQNTGDSLKYKAACFLIENMPWHSYYEGEQLDNYLAYYRILSENRKTGISPSALSDSIIKRFGYFSLENLSAKESIHRQVRKVTKTKGAFPNDMALLKLIYLATENIAKKWTQPLQNWSLPSSNFTLNLATE